MSVEVGYHEKTNDSFYLGIGGLFKMKDNQTLHDTSF